MFGISLYNNGKRSQLPSKAHIDFYVFTWPGDFIQRWLVTIYGQNMLDFHFIDSNHVTNPGYTKIIIV